MNKKRLLSLVTLLCCLQAAAAPFDLATATVADIQQALDKGGLTSEKLVRLYLARIDAYDQPFAVQFLGRPFTESTLIRLASGFEAVTQHRKAPKLTPALAGERFD